MSNGINGEIAWGTNRTLFYKHFEQKVTANAHGLQHVTVPPSVLAGVSPRNYFDSMVTELKSRYRNM